MMQRSLLGYLLVEKFSLCSNRGGRSHRDWRTSRRGREGGSVVGVDVRTLVPLTIGTSALSSMDMRVCMEAVHVVTMVSAIVLGLSWVCLVRWVIAAGVWGVVHAIWDTVHRICRRWSHAIESSLHGVEGVVWRLHMIVRTMTRHHEISVSRSSGTIDRVGLAGHVSTRGTRSDRAPTDPRRMVTSPSLAQALTEVCIETTCADSLGF